MKYGIIIRVHDIVTSPPSSMFKSVYFNQSCSMSLLGFCVSLVGLWCMRVALS